MADPLALAERSNGDGWGETWTRCALASERVFFGWEGAAVRAPAQHTVSVTVAPAEKPLRQPHAASRLCRIKLRPPVSIRRTASRSQTDGLLAKQTRRRMCILLRASCCCSSRARRPSAPMTR
jgi:hypothetical protein